MENIVCIYMGLVWFEINKLQGRIIKRNKYLIEYNCWLDIPCYYNGQSSMTYLLQIAYLFHNYLMSDQ